MDKKIGFIGCGNMGSAMLGGMLAAGPVKREQVRISCRSGASAERVHREYDVFASTDNRKTAAESDVIILAVKPHMFDTVIPEIRDVVTEEQLVISVAAGRSIASIEQAFGKEIRLVRMMPNTPAMVGAAMSAICGSRLADESDMTTAEGLAASFGRVEVVPESLMDVVVGVSGSSPAYVYMLLEAMADAAVADGMPRKQAYVFAAQSVMGAARMVLETGEHPGALKDAVCSPGGTTIEAVAALEAAGFRSAVITGQRACVARSKEMGRQE